MTDRVMSKSKECLAYDEETNWIVEVTILMPIWITSGRVDVAHPEPVGVEGHCNEGWACAYCRPCACRCVWCRHMPMTDNRW